MPIIGTSYWTDFIVIFCDMGDIDEPVLFIMVRDTVTDDVEYDTTNDDTSVDTLLYTTPADALPDPLTDVLIDALVAYMSIIVAGLPYGITTDIVRLAPFASDALVTFMSPSTVA